MFGYAMVENYRTLYAQAVDASDPRFVGGFGKYRHYSQPYTPANTDIVTPNNDTPYSWAWFDLRSEPWVVTVPAVERYYIIPIIPIHDLYTVYSGYIGSRTTGSGAGSYLLAGPDWSGTVPEGIAAVIRVSTQFAGTLTRTELTADGVDGLSHVQHSYRIEPLSAFQGTGTAAADPVVPWPIWKEEAAKGLGFYDYLDFLLAFSPVLDEDTEIREQMARIGLDGSGAFDSAALDADTAAAFTAGRSDAVAAINELEAHTTSSIGIFGTRQEMSGAYGKRSLGAFVGIYGLPPAEAWYGGWVVDASGDRPVGSRRYTITFSADELPTVRYFWSATMYTLPQRLLSANPIDRYSIGDRTSGLHYESGGGLTLYVQHDEPTDPAALANWLPAPEGPFTIIIRAYGGDERIVTGAYRLPALTPDPRA